MGNEFCDQYVVYSKKRGNKKRAANKKMFFFRAISTTFCDRLGFLVISGITQVGWFLYPLWRFYVFKRNCHCIQIGEFKCRLKSGCDLWTYFWDFVLPVTIWNIFTLGLYTLLGFATNRQNRFYDKHFEWYSVQ